MLYYASLCLQKTINKKQPTYRDRFRDDEMNLIKNNFNDVQLLFYYPQEVLKC